MKPAHLSFRNLIFLTAAAAVLSLAAGGSAQQPAAGETFPGVKSALSPDQYAATGLGKLSPEERAKLDDYLRGYFSGATERVVAQAEAHAVDRAVKEHKVEAPLLIETRIPGRISGWKSDHIFILENGQHWKVVDDSSRSFAPQDDPSVFIVKDSFGYKMAIPGGGIVRVKRLQ